MVAELEEPKSPVLANIVVIAGFAVLFSTFATDSSWSWIIGGALVLAGGLWAGYATGSPDTGLPEADTDAPEVTAPAAAQVEDGPGTGGQSHGRAH